MKKCKSTRKSLTKDYLTKFAGLTIEEADSERPDKENKNKTIILDKWVRHDFSEMGVVSYEEVDPT